MIVTTYVCDCCDAQSKTGASFTQATIASSSPGVTNTALLCGVCSKAASDAAQAALKALKGTQTGVVLP
jgi:hypothetical protein